ncbi:MAG: tetratricopeptide repeat protein [Armatimonadetes bacterium]|nr:tetratricopeptide repeat protein [Armatimonadota bacterium]
MTQPRPSPTSDLDALRRAEVAGAHVMAARNALRKGERERARELIKAAFAENPGDIAAIEFLGDLFLEEGETEQALGLFERALRAHPDYAPFEEKLAICRLDLAEIEADKLARQMLLTQGDGDKSLERSPAKAVTLSLCLPGAGQFYNDENESGVAFLAAGIVSCLAWFYPLWTALARLPRGQRLDVGAAISSLSGLEAMFFYLGAAIWIGVYIASVVTANASAQRFNAERRAVLGL